MKVKCNQIVYDCLVFSKVNFRMRFGHVIFCKSNRKTEKMCFSFFFTNTTLKVGHLEKII